MVTTRYYVEADLDEVVALWYRSWTKAFSDLKHPQSFEQWKVRFQNDYANNAEIWIAEISNKIVGFVIIVDNEIAQIFVDVDIQRKGIGTILINKAKQISAKGLKLTTLQQNIHAHHFYEKHGFLVGKMGMNPINGHPNIEYFWNP
jgi:ribosomal protein S18 acetylase RimI-like enzyme